MMVAAQEVVRVDEVRRAVRDAGSGRRELDVGDRALSVGHDVVAGRGNACLLHEGDAFCDRGRFQQ